MKTEEQIRERRDWWRNHLYSERVEDIKPFTPALEAKAQGYLEALEWVLAD